MSVFTLHVNWKITILLLKKKKSTFKHSIITPQEKKKKKVKSSLCVNTEKADKVNRKYSKMLQGTEKEVKSIHKY